MIPTLEQNLSEWARQAFCNLSNDIASLSDRISVVKTQDKQFGDYQCNAAMALAKTLKQNPRQIATDFVNNTALPESIDKLEIAGPGFINIHLNESHLTKLLADGLPLIPQVGAGKTVIMDYSGPNIAKTMHIGHLRSINIGSALDRIHQACGYKTISDNHLGDWGTQFGLIIKGYNEWADQQALKADPIAELERVYVKSTAEAKENEEWKEAARAELVKLQQGDAENKALWQSFIDWSLPELDKIYNRFNVRFDLTRGESFYNDQLPSVLEALKQSGHLKPSEGAQIVDLEDEKLNVAIVQKSDGGFNYMTTDLATVKSRLDEFSPAAIIYVTDTAQQLHFKQLFNISGKLGWNSANLIHVWFGRMSMADGKISSREGNAIRLEALLDEAVERATAIIKEKNVDMSEEEIATTAAAVGVGAVKYADLSQNLQTEVTFTWDKAMALDGNSGPYLQYSYARSAKLHRDFTELNDDYSNFEISNEDEKQLAVKILQYPDMVLVSLKNYRPNILCEYLFELAGQLNSYYQKYHIKGEAEDIAANRLRFNVLAGQVIKAGLELIGLDAPERI